MIYYIGQLEQNETGGKVRENELAEENPKAETVEKPPFDLVEALIVPHTALVVMDMQNNFLQSFYGDTDGLINEHKLLINFCNIQKIPVFFVGLAMDDTWGSNREIHQDLLDLAINPAEQVICKPTDDAFLDTDFADRLRAADVQRIVIIGTHIDGCIYLSAVSGKKQGFEVYASDYGSLIHDKNQYYPVRHIFNRLGIHFLRRD